MKLREFLRELGTEFLGKKNQVFNIAFLKTKYLNFVEISVAFPELMLFQLSAFPSLTHVSLQ